MNENDTNSSDGTYTTGAVSTAAATVHSDDFQMPRPSALRYCDDNRGEGSPFRQTSRKDLPDEESENQFVTTELESDSRVPSVSSQASIPSTSSCNSNKDDSTDQERPLQIMNSSDVWKEDEGPLKGQKTREALWKRHQREAKRIAWERRYAARLCRYCTRLIPCSLGQPVIEAVPQVAPVRHKPFTKEVAGMGEGGKGSMMGH